jgi:hypothetical protein
LSASKINAGTLSASYISAGTLNCANFTITNLNASSITAGTLSVDRIATNSINGVKIGTGVNGVNTTNIVSGAVTYSAAGSAQPGFINPANATWIASFSVTIPANSNRGAVFTQIMWVADGGSTSSPVYLNLRLKRGGVTLITSAYNAVLNTLTLSWCDTSAPTSSFVYDVEVWYDRAFVGGFYRTLTASIFELKR